MPFFSNKPQDVFQRTAHTSQTAIFSFRTSDSWSPNLLNQKILHFNKLPLCFLLVYPFKAQALGLLIFSYCFLNLYFISSLIFIISFLLSEFVLPLLILFGAGLGCLLEILLTYEEGLSCYELPSQRTAFAASLVAQTIKHLPTLWETWV